MIDFKLFYEPEGRLRVTLSDRSYIEVRPAWGAPLSHPGKYLSLLDGKNKEILMIRTLEEVSEENRSILENEIHKRYLSSRVTGIKSVRTEFGVTYWTVDTDRGPRELVTQSLQENAEWMTPDFLVLTDVAGNRYEIKVSTLDERSCRFVEMTV